MYKLGIIAKYWNEEVLLPHWLEWIQHIPADHIFLGDDGSTDASQEICRKYKHQTATVHHHTLEHPHEGYFESKLPEGEKVNGMLIEAYLAGCDWVLHLDIDEFPSTPMLSYLQTKIKQIPPEYGVYFPIWDCFETITQVIFKNKYTGYYHYPYPHLKISGRQSRYTRVIDGMKLDQGVTGGDSYIMTSRPYLHLKGLFKNRRNARGHPLTAVQSPVPKASDFDFGIIQPMYIPKYILEWFHKFKEPSTTW